MSRKLPPATPKQLAYLQALAFGSIPDGLDTKQASELIDALEAERNKTRPATAKQLAFVEDLWGIPDSSMSMADVRRYIDYLTATLPVTTCCRAEYVRSDTECPRCGKKSPIIPIQTKPCPKEWRFGIIPGINSRAR